MQKKAFSSFFFTMLFVFLFLHEINYGADTAVRKCLIRSTNSTNLTDSNLIFNANMLTSGSVLSPNIAFGIGIDSPIINAWSMHSSALSQLPINIQFSIPGDLRTEKPVSIELHFLVRKQLVANGNARIRINALYVHNGGEFSVSNSMMFTHTNDSYDFEIVEPTQANDLVHIFIDVPIAKSDINPRDLALISFTRILPDAEEYEGDIYLVAAVFRYTEK